MKSASPWPTGEGMTMKEGYGTCIRIFASRQSAARRNMIRRTRHDGRGRVECASL